jgi:membrane protease YdiL (CAAX protease family)
MFAPASWARGRQLLFFFIMAYALSWWPWIWFQFDPVTVDAPIFPWGPFIAALAMLATIGGWPAVRTWFGKIIHWRVAPIWYVIVLLGPPALTLTAVGINRVLGAEFAANAEFPTWQDLLARFVFILLLIGLGEEPAWRGYALPRLIAGRTALAASLILGLLHAIWHLPLFGIEYDLQNIVPWTASVLCVAIVITWIWLHTGGSLLLPILLHTSNNTIAFFWGTFAGTDQLRLWWIWAALWVAATAIVVVVNGPALIRTKPSAATA